MKQRWNVNDFIGWFFQVYNLIRWTFQLPIDSFDKYKVGYLFENNGNKGCFF